MIVSLEIFVPLTHTILGNFSLISVRKFYSHFFFTFLLISRSRQANVPLFLFFFIYSFKSDLQDSFGDLALFFCDPYGGTVIAVLWKPKAFKPVPFKVSADAGLYPQCVVEGAAHFNHR